MIPAFFSNAVITFHSRYIEVYAKMTINIQSRSRLFPSLHHQIDQETIKPLSILDATVLDFSTSGCVLFYAQPLNLDLLKRSLEKTLDAYPQWAGQIRFSQYKPDAGHHHRQGRLELAYGTSADPGIEYIVARADYPMSAMIPSPEATKIWDATQVDYQALLNMDTPFGLNKVDDPKGVPSMKVQFTTFTSPGVAVAIGLLHPLADAQTLLHFTHDWAAVNRALFSSLPVPAPTPVFKSSLLDNAAAGDINASTPDPAVLEKASKLPLHRYDFWASADDAACPDWARDTCQIPAELDMKEDELVKGPQVPWGSWDRAAPVSHVNFFFTHAEVHAMYLQAAAHSPMRLSHQDALLAHLWSALVRARRLEEGSTHYLDITLDVRRRLKPALPSSFIGSPIFNAACATIASNTMLPDDLAKKVGERAASTRKTIQEFDADSMAALLHEMAFEPGAQRRRNGFLGDNHVIVTSWLGIGLGDVVFEPDVRSVWAEALMPSCDGVLQVMEGSGGMEQKTEKTDLWWTNGITASVWLKTDVMERLIVDENLRTFAR